MAVWWPVWPLVLCLICAWLAVGLGLGLGVFWVLAGGVARGGVAAVISGAGLAGALCALVWHVWGAGAGQQMLSGFSAFWCVGWGLGVVAGLALGVAVVASSGVAPLVRIPDVSGSGLGCCGWLGAGRVWGWGLGGSLGGCRRLPVYYILFS